MKLKVIAGIVLIAFLASMVSTALAVVFPTYPPLTSGTYDIAYDTATEGTFGPVLVNTTHIRVRFTPPEDGKLVKEARIAWHGPWGPGPHTFEIHLVDADTALTKNTSVITETDMSDHWAVYDVSGLEFYTEGDFYIEFWGIGAVRLGVFADHTSPVSGRSEANFNNASGWYYPSGWPASDFLIRAVVGPNPPVEINEFLANPSGTESGKEWVEIINTGTISVNVTDWYLTDGETTWTITTNTSIGPRECYVFDGLTGLANSGDDLWLYDQNGILVDNKNYTSSEAYEDESSHQIYDGLYDLWDRDTAAPSKGYPNHVNPGSVKVNEVYYRNDSMTPVEFIEIYNTGSTAVNIDNWNIRYKFFVFDLMGSLDAGEHAVLYWNVNFTTYLHNDYGFVCVINENNQTVDRMTWGTQRYYKDDGTYTNFPYYCPNPAYGHSLERIPAGRDIDMDSEDFYDQPDPSPCTLLERIPGVGGEITPIDKLLMLMPWIGLAASVTVASVSAVVYRKKYRGF